MVAVMEVGQAEMERAETVAVMEAIAETEREAPVVQAILAGMRGEILAMLQR